MQRDQSADLTEFVLRPSARELRDTHILFHARHAHDSSRERFDLYGYPVVEHEVILKALRHLGFKVTPKSEPEALLGPLDYDYIYSLHLQSFYEGHELLCAAIAASHGIPFIGAAAGADPRRCRGQGPWQTCRRVCRSSSLSD